MEREEKQVILSGHQPNYWPYPGLIGQIMLSDSFVYVTKVQFEKKSWQKRNRIRTKEGWNYLQVPTITKGKFDQNICDVEIDNATDWREKTVKTIQLLYGKAPFYKEYEEFIKETYSREWQYLSELDIHIMDFLLEHLGCDTKIYYDRDRGTRLPCWWICADSWAVIPTFPTWAALRMCRFRSLRRQACIISI